MSNTNNEQNDSKKTPDNDNVIHENCGTPDCCGECKPREDVNRDANYEAKLREFFKGRTS